MASDRVQTNLNLGIEPLRPFARPVDTFVNPGRAAPLDTRSTDTARSLVEALAQAEPKLTRFLDEQRREQLQEQQLAEVAKGDRLGMVAQDVKSWQEAVDKGVVQPSDSKWVRKGFMEARGRVLGFGYQEQLNALYADWDGKSNVQFITDPKTGDKSVDTSPLMSFLGQQRENALKGLPDDPDLFRSFSNQMQQIEQNVLAEHRRYVQDKLKEDILQTHYEELSGALKSAQQNGNYDGALEVINAVNGSARFARMLSGSEINEQTIKAITAQARLMASNGYAGDALKLLDLSQRDRPDGTKGAGRTARGALQIEEAREHVSFMQMRLDEHSYHQEKRQQKEDADGAMREVVSNLITNPGYQPPQALLMRGVQADPEFAHRVQAMQNGFRMSADRDDPRQRTELARLVYTRNISVNEVAAFPGVSSATKQGLMADAGRVENSSLATDPIVTRAVGSMKEAIFDPLTSKGFGKDMYDAQSAEAMAYETLLSEEGRWRKANPGTVMTPLERLDLVNKVTSAIAKSFRAESISGNAENPAFNAARKNLSSALGSVDGNVPPTGPQVAAPRVPKEWEVKPLFKNHTELKAAVNGAAFLGRKTRFVELLEQYGLQTMAERQAFLDAQARLLRGKP